ncbi:hypothetical protein C1646_810349 [Rhizophagus diaphanus]|nr:hypothetical protein C1646_810349 [Rhizophagus diaphanus] [Rhizophagus sp. MUCL 43196]
MIHPSINVSKANTFEEISNTLKNDIFFISFKHSVKEKLQKLKFDPKDKIYVQFINIFREYCYEAEINVEKQKKLLLENFIKEQKLIRFGSCITLKHVATGKYLTSCNVRYKTGSGRRIVFASQTLSKPNSLWIILGFDQKNENNPIIYGKSKVNFINKGVNESIFISDYYKSPSTGNWEESDSTNNDDICIKSKEIINIRNMNENFILRSHEFHFTFENETYQEIGGHKGRVDENDKWCIELFESE